MGASLIEQWADLDADKLEQVLAAFTEEELDALWRSWQLYARPEQLAPDWLWRWWLVLTGRGFGKTRCGAEWVVDRCELFAAAGWPHLVGLMNKTNDDVRAIQLHGESGLGAVCERRGHHLDHVGSSLHGGIVIITDTGVHRSNLEVHTGMDPDRSRGRNFATVWADETGSWKFRVDNLGNTAFTNMDLSLRARCPPGEIPRGMVTTTPKPIPVIRDLVAGEHGATAVTRGSMLANRANLPKSFIQAIVKRYGGTRLGRQEIEGMILDDVEGALWTMSLIEKDRLKSMDYVPELATKVIAVDPSGSEGGDECGIIVVAVGRERDHLGRPHVYVLGDYSVQNRPAVWGPTVVNLYHKLGCDMVVAETNFGGLLVVDTIRLRDSSIYVERVTATRGKRIRAEPVSTIYETGQAHHVGVFPELEEQMCTWTPLEPTSPDRLDALVWGVTWLIPELATPPADFARGFADQQM